MLLEESINKAKAANSVKVASSAKETSSTSSTKAFSSNADTFDKKIEKAYQVYKSNTSIHQVQKLKEAPSNEPSQNSGRHHSKVATEFGQSQYDTSLSVFDKEKSVI